MNWHDFVDAIKQGLLEVDLRTREIRITSKGLRQLAQDFEEKEEEI